MFRDRRDAGRQVAEPPDGHDIGPDLAGTAVAVVDDGFATGATVRACVR